MVVDAKRACNPQTTTAYAPRISEGASGPLRTALRLVEQAARTRFAWLVCSFFFAV